MDTNTKELNLNELEQVNGGFVFPIPDYIRKALEEIAKKYLPIAK